jgi:hypothetical protein
MNERRDERERMVATQIAARGVADASVLSAMRRVPRHRFVPASEAARAYDDGPLAIGRGQLACAFFKGYPYAPRPLSLLPLLLGKQPFRFHGA